MVVDPKPTQRNRDGDAAAASAAAARGTTPERLRRRLAGDLDAIALRAMEPDPTARYQSAQQLLDDVDRHLRKLPVRARAPGLAYRSARFVRRNRAPLAVAGVVFLSLCGGLGAAIWQASETARERDRAEHERLVAEQERDRAEQVTAFLAELFGAADPHANELERVDTLRLRDVIDRGVVRIREELVEQPRLRSEMLTVLGRVYTNLGLYEPAEDLLVEVLELDRLATGPLAGRTLPLALLAAIETQRNELARADSLYRELFAAYDDAGEAPDSLYIASLTEHGVVHAYGGDYTAAGAQHQRAIELVRSHDGEGRHLHARVLNNLAMLSHDLGQYAAAESLFVTVHRIEKALLRPDHPRHASTLNNLAASIHYQGRHVEAEPVYREAIEIARGTLGVRHPEVPNYMQNLATLFDDQGRHREADPLYAEAVNAYEELFGYHSPRTALVVRNYALNRLAAGRLEEAEALLRRAHFSFANELGPGHLYTALASTALGRVLLANGLPTEAAVWITAGIPVLEDQLPADHFLLAMAHTDLGASLVARGAYAAAESLLLASHATLLDGQGAFHHGTVAAREQLHKLYLTWGRPEQAESYLPAQ